MLISTASTLEAAKAASTFGGRGYMLLSPTWMDPSRYTVLVDEVAFHIKERPAALAGACTGVWAWHTPKATKAGKRRTRDARRLLIIDILLSNDVSTKECEVDYTGSTACSRYRMLGSGSFCLKTCNRAQLVLEVSSRAEGSSLVPKALKIFR